MLIGSSHYPRRHAAKMSVRYSGKCKLAISCNLAAAACATVAQRPASRLAQLEQALNANTERQRDTTNSCILRLQPTVGGKRGLSCTLCAPRVYNVCRGDDVMLSQDEVSQHVCLKQQ